MVNNKNTRKAKVYHSNDVKNDDPYYLVFPLKDASKSNKDQGPGSKTGLTNRRMMAYSAALGVTGKIPRRREKLQAMILATDGVGIARPSSRGIHWVLQRILRMKKQKKRLHIEFSEKINRKIVLTLSTIGKCYTRVIINFGYTW